MNTFRKVALVFLLLVGASITCGAQKGLGDNTGIAREGENLQIFNVTGEVVEIKVGPCEQTTGRADLGFHLIIQLEDESVANLHLGPADALKKVRDTVSIGQRVSAKAFRSEKMPEDACIAKTITIGDEVFSIRDNYLRPIWAASRGMGGGRAGKR